MDSSFAAFTSRPQQNEPTNPASSSSQLPTSSNSSSSSSDVTGLPSVQQRSHKPRSWHVNDQHKRRQDALQRQKAARRDFQLHARRIAEQAFREDHIGGSNATFRAAARGETSFSEWSLEGYQVEAVSSDWDEAAERHEGEDEAEACEPAPRIAELDEQTGEWREIDRRGMRVGEAVRGGRRRMGG